MNALPVPDAEAALRRCCGSRRWVERILAGLPYASDAALLEAAEREWWALERADWLEAFAAHPRIGERGVDAWSRREQSGVDDAAAEVRRALEQGNRDYEARFGHVYLVCATGRGAADLLADLRRRLGGDPEQELRIAAGEQAKITALRLEKLGGE
ncbi:MAG TPA: 2-oxo-4-hydroxy-4-carboxy-5-ureidoimidazoline decarboxylase [Gemmatimonadales bacterium]|nr:2-oxo-4-hydroxy-4-carboxy-5-ureidoimidazoline decarboxylase [Gemmatimonadales bacterium]